MNQIKNYFGPTQQFCQNMEFKPFRILELIEQLTQIEALSANKTLQIIDTFLKFYKNYMIGVNYPKIEQFDTWHLLVIKYNEKYFENNLLEVLKPLTLVQVN